MKISFLFAGILCYCSLQAQKSQSAEMIKSSDAVKHDVSKPLFTIHKEAEAASAEIDRLSNNQKPFSIKKTPDFKSFTVEQTRFGSKASPILVSSFEGLGESFSGPQGKAVLRNPSDNSLAVGLDHIVQTVNSRMAIFTKKGKKCEQMNNGDAVVRYDQLANRWLIVMPTFRKGISRNIDTATGIKKVLPQPGAAVQLYQPPATTQNNNTAPPPRPAGQRPPDKGT